MVDWGVVCLLAATVGPIVRWRGLWAVTACATVLQSMPVSYSCHFRGCKAPLSRIVVSGAISSELALPFYLLGGGTAILWIGAEALPGVC